MNALVFSLAFAALALAAGGLAKPFDRRLARSGVVLFAAYLALDDFVTGLPHLVPALDFLPGEWNWSGKVLSLVFAALVIVALRLSPDAVGLRLRQEHARTGAVAVALFVVWGACLGLAFKPGAPDAETLAFQATMPGLAEELAYRGIAPALLLSLWPRRPHVDGIPWSVVLATSVMFGLWHALSYADGRFGFDLMSGLFPFLGSLPGGWLRFRTKSLVVPIAGHGLANVAFHLAGGLAS
ncbi:MAG TPA: CPBP family intramembrane glutamic endopeptidase [Luteimonas sp.]|nr:CPBP family intramembrane glutamic endopeptidase [Luteimonas sp.]